MKKDIAPQQMSKKEYAKKYYQENKDRLYELEKIRIASNPDKYLERWRSYAARNQEKLQTYRKDYYIKNKDRLIEKGRAWSKANKEKKHKNYMSHRERFLDTYGRTCSCCGESIVEFLTLEHIQGRESDEKRSLKISAEVSYKKANKEYRPDLYETLCMNCNHAKGRFGFCPHQKITIGVYENSQQNSQIEI